MKKIVYFVGLPVILLILLIVFLVFRLHIDDTIRLNIEKIGAESSKPYEMSIYDFGKVKNYKKSLNGNTWTTEFEYMDTTDYEVFNIKTDDIFRINSKVDSGEVWIKITQGALVLSEIQKVLVTNNDVTKVDLSQWKNGEVVAWLVVEKGENGLIQIEHIEN